MSRRVALLLLLALNLPAGAADVRIEPRPGTPLPMEATLQDESNRPVTLRGAMAGGPWILVLGYFNCPNLCDTVRADLLVALKGMAGNPPYRVAAISIDPREGAADAHEARVRDAAYQKSPEAWRYLRADAATLASLTAAVGFRYREDSATGQIAHPSGLVFVTPAGKVAGYLAGVGYRSDAVARSLEEAARGRIDSAPPAAVALLCFDYDDATGRYSWAVIKLLRIVAVFSVLLIGGGLLALFRRPRAAA